MIGQFLGFDSWCCSQRPLESSQARWVFSFVLAQMQSAVHKPIVVLCDVSGWFRVLDHFLVFIHAFEVVVTVILLCGLTTTV